MALYTTRPGLSDENSKRYYELNQEIMELQQKLNLLSDDDKEAKRKMQDEIQKKLMEQVSLTMK